MVNIQTEPHPIKGSIIYLAAEVLSVKYTKKGTIKLKLKEDQSGSEFTLEYSQQYLNSLEPESEKS